MYGKKIKELEAISSLLESDPIDLSIVDFATQTFALIEDAILGGGLLMSVYAIPRLTIDLDLILAASSKAKDILLNNGYVQQDHLQYSKPNREIIKLEKHKREVDLIFFKDKKVEAFLVSTAVTKHVFGKDIKILSLEGFLLTKLISWRIRDMADIEAVLERRLSIDMDALNDLAMHLKIFDRMSILTNKAKIYEAI